MQPRGTEGFRVHAKRTGEGGGGGGAQTVSGAPSASSSSMSAPMMERVAALYAMAGMQVPASRAALQLRRSLMLRYIHVVLAPRRQRSRPLRSTPSSSSALS